MGRAELPGQEQLEAGHLEAGHLVAALGKDAWMHRLARGLLRDAHAAEDLVQDAWPEKVRARAVRDRAQRALFGADRIARVRVRGPGEHELRVIIERIREVLQDSDEITPSPPATHLIDAPREGAPQRIIAPLSPGKAAAAIERLSNL